MNRKHKKKKEKRKKKEKELNSEQKIPQLDFRIDVLKWLKQGYKQKNVSNIENRAQHGIKKYANIVKLTK